MLKWKLVSILGRPWVLCWGFARVRGCTETRYYLLISWICNLVRRAGWHLSTPKESPSLCANLDKMQYAIINGRTHELLAGITFYSIYSHLNWVETLMRQWCTAPESCLPPGWPPWVIQMWSENESRYSAAGGRSERSDRNAQAALLRAVYPSVHASCRRGDGQLNDHRWCGKEAQHQAEATHVETCMHRLLQIHTVTRSSTACTLMCIPRS